jgi:hypothetical protein
MKMRCVLVGLAFVAAASGSAMAYENFIPMGAGYSSSVSEVPEFGSAKGKVNSRADVYETEIYRKGRKKVEAESRLRQFFSDRNANSTDGFIDY